MSDKVKNLFEKFVLQTDKEYTPEVIQDKVKDKVKDAVSAEEQKIIDEGVKKDEEIKTAEEAKKAEENKKNEAREEEVQLESLPEDVQELYKKAEKNFDELTEDEVKVLTDNNLLEGDDEGGSKTPADSIHALMEDLHKKNNWEYNKDEFEKEFDNSPDGLNEFIKNVIDNNEPEYASQEVEDFNKFVSNGGDPSEFLKVYYKDAINLENLDMESEDAQKQVYSDYLKRSTNFSDKKIEKEINSKSELGELEAEMDEAIDYIKKSRESEKESLKEEQKKLIDKQKSDNDKYLSDMKEKIMGSKEIAGWEMDKKELEELYKFGFERDRNGRTAYQKMRESDPEMDMKLLLLAKKGLDKNKIEKSAETKVVKKLKKNISRFTDKSAKTTNNTAPKDKTKGVENDFSKWVI